VEARWARLDLHLHTVLSACAEAEMTPPRIVERALELGLAGIAITDHNSAENVAAVQEAAAGTGLVVVAGLEIQTAEEVDLLALFDELSQALTVQDRVYAGLGRARNRPEFFGEQIVVDRHGYPIRENTLLLQGRTDLSIEEAARLVHDHGGLAVAAHIDRPSRSLLGTLGFLPVGLDLDGIEVSRHANLEQLQGAHPGLAKLGAASFGDAHRLSEMGGRTEFLLRGVRLQDIGRCFRGECSGALRITDRTGQGA